MALFKKVLAKTAEPPKYWDTDFACTVIDAYRSGQLTMSSIGRWEANYANAHTQGFMPLDGFGTKAILQYHINTGKVPSRYSRY